MRTTMHSALLVSTCIAGSALAAWAVTSASSPAPVRAEASAATVDAADLAALRAEIEELRRERAFLPTPAPASRVAAEPESLRIDDVEDTVRRLVSVQALAPERTGAVAWPGGARDARQAFRGILDAGVDGEAATELWEEAAEHEQLHEILAAMEEHMATLPESADKHYARARAYYAAARAKPWNTEGNWWVDSNDAYSQTLEHDPAHWDARYQKARNMAFWPVAYGGQAEAIRHFEILVDQQRTSAQRPEFAKTYLWLGNLYDQQGRTELARDTWNEGLGVFPDDDQIQQRLDSLGGGS